MIGSVSSDGRAIARWPTRNKPGLTSTVSQATAAIHLTNRLRTQRTAHIDTARDGHDQH